MKFKNYEREYEYVFSDEEKIKQKCDINKVGVHLNNPGSEAVYSKLLQETFGSLHDEVFNHMVKITWLIRRFTYNGVRRKEHKANGMYLDKAYAVYMRDYIGYDNKMFIGRYSCISRVMSYVDDFYINFDDISPFEHEYKYPYKYMKFEFISLVYMMEERMELLDYCEKKQMKYSEFLDYVINYIGCYNNEHGETYAFLFNIGSLPYIKIL